MSFDVDQFEERAAIMEFSGGLSRFEAETLAAKAQGVSRHEAIRIGYSEATRHHDQSADGNAAHDLPRVQQRQAQESRPMPSCHVQAGWGCLALSSLWLVGWGLV